MTQLHPEENGVRRQAVWDALKQLAPRRPAEPPREDADVRWERVDVDRYRVTSGSCTAGFVDVVGAVFVVLAGDRYDRAIEVAQTLQFERAIEILVPSPRVSAPAESD